MSERQAAEAALQKQGRGVVAWRKKSMVIEKWVLALPDVDERAMVR